MKYNQATLLLWKSFWKFHALTVLVFLLLSLISGFCEVIFIFLLRFFAFNQVSNPFLVVSIALLLMLFRTVIQILNIRYLTQKIQNWSDQLKNNLYQELLQRAFPLHRLKIAKDWKKLHLQLTPFIRKGLFSLLFSLSAMIQILLCVSMIFVFPWVFVLSLFVLIFPIIFFSRWRIKILNKVGSDWMSTKVQNDSMIEEFSNSLDFICGNQQLEMVLKQIKISNEIRGRQESRWDILQLVFPYIMEFLYFIIALILFSFILPSFNFLGDLLPFVVLILLLYRPIREWSRLYPDVNLGNRAFLSWNNFIVKIKNAPILKPQQWHDKLTIECVDLSFSYHQKIIFSNLNQTLDLTKIILLIGENGVGKTTFLKLLSRMEFPNSGCILYSKQIPKIIYLSQQHSFSPFWLEQVQQLQKEYPQDFIDLSQILKVAGLLDRMKESSQVHDFSEGEKQRLHLLQCLLKPYPFVLMDEPTAWISLDSKVKMMENIILYWKNRWKRLDKFSGMLIVSHDQDMKKLAEIEIKL